MRAGVASPRPRVLLVDDRAENLLALRAVLETLEVDLVEVSSGEEALRRLLRDEFALVVLDVQMPSMDGFETARLIKERGRTRYLPIIFLTAIANQPEHYLRGYATGAVDYVAKPFDPDILRSKVAVFAELWARGATIDAQRAELAERLEQLDKAHGTLARQAAELERSNAALERFAQVVGAEIREPLHTAAGLLELLLHRHASTLSGEAQMLAERAAGGLERTVARVRDVLTDARAELYEMSPEPVDLGEALLEAQARLDEPVKVIVASPLPTVSGDHSQLVRLLASILDNALRFRAPAPPEVTVTAERSAAGWRIALSDNGRGVEPVELPRLFTVFARPTTSTSEETEGAGLGLAVCRRIAERHRGTIWAEPNEWGGTKIFLDLPGVRELPSD